MRHHHTSHGGTLSQTARPKSLWSFSAGAHFPPHHQQPSPGAPRGVQPAAAGSDPSDPRLGSIPHVFCNCHNTQRSPCFIKVPWDAEGRRAANSQALQTASIPPLHPTVAHKSLAGPRMPWELCNSAPHAATAQLAQDEAGESLVWINLPASHSKVGL